MATVYAAEPGAGIVEVPCESAEQLCTALADRMRVTSAVSERWLFRGQSDAALGLRPSALRDGARLLDPNEKWVQSPFETEREQVAHEMRTIHAFCRTADAAGLELPEDSQGLRARFNKTVREIDNRIDDPTWQWPPDELLSICALGQHHVLPTRLLDWSYNPLVAAYFAAEGAAKRLSEGRAAKDLCVWALSERALDVWHQLREGERTAETEGKTPRIVRVTAPTASNANLRAQKGLFLLVRYPKAPPAERPVNMSVAELVASGELGNTVLVRFVLASTAAPALLRMLAEQFVTAATIYPGLNGVVIALHEQGFWDAPVADGRPGPRY